jgi:microcystin-dependent protein
MPTASVPYSFTNGINADATQVNANLNSLISFINTNVIQKDASVAFTAIPVGPATDPTAANEFARKAYVDNVLPAGVILDFGGSVAPSGYVLCDGTTYDGALSAYSRLFAAIGLTYGGSGVNFQVPDLRGRITVGKAASGTFAALNGNGGSETVTLAVVNLPLHQHDLTHSHGHSFSVNDNPTDLVTRESAFVDGGFSSGTNTTPWNALSPPALVTNVLSGTWTTAGMAQSYITAHGHGLSGSISAATGNTGFGSGLAQPVPTLPPYRVLNKIIKL